MPWLLIPGNVWCSDCVVACQTENYVPIGYSRDWIREIIKGVYPDLHLEIRSERCNHCDNSPCVRSCPTGASHYEEGGIVKVTKNKCIGCSACIVSCPYNARYIHPDGYVDKCTFCDHRVKKGEKPACVATCPTTCMYFGDLDNPDSEISGLLKRRQNKTLIPEAGTSPRVYFLF
jgi:Fe-S-cluster-containing dehydrogenase component